MACLTLFHHCQIYPFFFFICRFNIKILPFLFRSISGRQMAPEGSRPFHQSHNDYTTWKMFVRDTSLTHQSIKNNNKINKNSRNTTTYHHRTQYDFYNLKFVNNSNFNFTIWQIERFCWCNISTKSLNQSFLLELAKLSIILFFFSLFLSWHFYISLFFLTITIIQLRFVSLFMQVYSSIKKKKTRK